MCIDIYYQKLKKIVATNSLNDNKYQYFFLFEILVLIIGLRVEI